MRKQDCRSVIQADFATLLQDGEHCVHHVFPGSRRKICEKYGFLVALDPEVHDFIHDHPNKFMDLMLKRECQHWYECHAGTRQDFIREFGRSYL